MEPQTQTPPEDLKRLRSLSFSYSVLGVFHGLLACFAFAPIYYGFVILAGDGPREFYHPHFLSPEIFASVFFIFGALLLGPGGVFAGSMIAAGRFIREHRRYKFCKLLASFLCFSVPLGTVLGLFTLSTFRRPAVQKLFTPS